MTRLGILDVAGIARLRVAHAAGRPELGPVVWQLALLSRWLERPERAIADRDGDYGAGGTTRSPGDVVEQARQKTPAATVLVCRAGLAGRDTPVAPPTERYTSDPDPEL